VDIGTAFRQKSQNHGHLSPTRGIFADSPALNISKFLIDRLSLWMYRIGNMG